MARTSILLAACLGFGLTQAVEAAEHCRTMSGAQAYQSQSICVSSVLPPQAGNRYDVRSLTDFNTATAWCEGVAGPGVGEAVTLRYEFAAPVQAIRIRNGYGKSDRAYSRNGRIRDVRISVSSETDGALREMTHRLLDHSWEQVIALPWQVDRPARITLTILSVYPGTHYQDTCITELWADFGM